MSRKQSNQLHANRPFEKTLASLWKQLIQLRPLTIGVMCFLYAIPLSAQPPTVDNKNAWSGIFAGKLTIYPVTVSGTPYSHISVDWQLVLKNRTVASGIETGQLDGSGITVVGLPLKTPPLNSGVVLKAKLLTHTLVDGSQKNNLHQEFQLDVYSREPNPIDRKAFQALGIQLFDPVGKTQKLLDDLDVPYAILTKLQLNSASKSGLVLIGKGVELDEQKGLSSTLLELARNGHRVLVLQPKSGIIFLPAKDEVNSQASAMVFSDGSITASLAENHRWIPGDTKATTGLVLDQYLNSVIARVVPAEQSAWQWLRLSFDHSKGKLIVCTLPFLNHVEESPISALFFRQILKYAHSYDEQKK